MSSVCSVLMSYCTYGMCTKPCFSVQARSQSNRLGGGVTHQCRRIAFIRANNITLFYIVVLEFQKKGAPAVATCLV